MRPFSGISDMRINLVPVCGICLNTVNFTQGKILNLWKKIFFGFLYRWTMHI